VLSHRNILHCLFPQVRKRAGQLLPEIRPNVVDVQRRSELLAGGAAQSSELAPRSPVPTVVSLLQRDDNILAQTDADLTLDFQGYLAANRALVDGMREEANGEIVFRSNDALSTLVVGFTRQKLQALAISARSLARYVNDLETELEAADEAVVEMRRQQQESAKRQAKSERHARSLEVTASELELKLAEAAERLAASEAAAAQQEHRAEAAAEELMRMQSELEAKAAARALESNASETRSNDMDTEVSRHPLGSGRDSPICWRQTFQEEPLALAFTLKNRGIASHTDNGAVRQPDCAWG